ncbi:hypothetical protein Vretimale_18588 [Volvox reticuliferus]|uniref:Uncharacterized protein n=1 Tax=Volvox reticuliferus TaxID=1737510 RepID=A0A8J4GXG6_9CHLO|nr:hypothetical protein Vretimale_18588 [Volvox reticuliferus]
MKRTTCVGCILALLVCVRGQADGSQWQDKSQQYYQQCQHDQRQQEQYQDIMAGGGCGNNPSTGTHQQQAPVQQQWVQEEGMANIVGQADAAFVTESQSTQPQEQERYMDAAAAGQGYLVPPESSDQQARVAMGEVADNQYELYLQGMGQLSQELQQKQLELNHQRSYSQQEQYSIGEAGARCDARYTDAQETVCSEEGINQWQKAEEHANQATHPSAEVHDNTWYNAAAADADKSNVSDNSNAAGGLDAENPGEQRTEHSSPATSSDYPHSNVAQLSLPLQLQDVSHGQDPPEQDQAHHHHQTLVDLHQVQSEHVVQIYEEVLQVESQWAQTQNSDSGWQQQQQEAADPYQAQDASVAQAEEQAQQVESQWPQAQYSDLGHQQEQEAADPYQAQDASVAQAEEQVQQVESQWPQAQYSDSGWQQQQEQAADPYQAQDASVAQAEEQAQQVESQWPQAQYSDSEWQQQQEQAADPYQAQDAHVAQAEEQVQQVESQWPQAQYSDLGHQQEQEVADLHHVQDAHVAQAEEQAQQVESQWAEGQINDLGHQQEREAADPYQAQDASVAQAEEQAQQVESQWPQAQYSDSGWQQQQEQAADPYQAQDAHVAQAEEQAQQVESQWPQAQYSDSGWQQQQQEAADPYQAQDASVAQAEEQAQQVESEWAQVQNNDVGQQQEQQQAADPYQAQDAPVAQAQEQAQQVESQQVQAQNNDLGQHQALAGVVNELVAVSDQGSITTHFQATAAVAQVAGMQPLDTLDPVVKQQQESQLANQDSARSTSSEEPLPLTAAEAVRDAGAAEGSGIEGGHPDSGVNASARVSDTDAVAAALTDLAQAEASGGPSHSKPATVIPRGDGTFEAASEADRVAAQAAAEAASLHPLRGMKRADVETKLLEAQVLIYANTSCRNMTAGLVKLRELHELVEAALPSSPMVRARLPPPPAADDNNSSSAGNQTTTTNSSNSSNAEPPRPLVLEVAESRHAGLHAAAAATFQLAALQASGVMPPDVLPYDPMSAALALHQAARAGSLEALMSLADRYTQGISTPASCSRGLQFGKLAAMYLVADVEKEQRYAPSLAPVSLRERFADGGYVAAEDAENGQHVINLEEDMAFRGNADAIRRMAYRRLVGRGMEADPEGAFHDFQIAAAQGDPYAIFNIGYMYLRGLYVAQNFSAAKEQFEKAAQKGLPSAHNGLGVLAWNGQGMAPNLTAARESFERGALLNNSDSVYNLATMHFHGAGTPVNQTLAMDLFKRALELGHWRAPYMLALAYEVGAGAEANCSRAMQYLRLLFADRSTWGKQLTAAVRLLDSGDARGALLTYITVAEQGSSAAAANAAWLLRRRVGYSGADADRLAAKYFQRAAKQGHTSSMVELAHMILEAAIRTAALAPATAGEPANITAPVEATGRAGTERSEEESVGGGPKEAVPLSKVAPSSDAEGNSSGAAADMRASTETVDGANTTAATVVGEALQGVGDGRAATREVSNDVAAIIGGPSANSEPSADTTTGDTATTPAGAGNGDGSNGEGRVAVTAQSAAVDTSSANSSAASSANSSAASGANSSAASGANSSAASSANSSAASGANSSAASGANSSANSSDAASSNATDLFTLPPLKSSTKRPPPPPLVLPAALPTHRVVLGVSKAADAVAWYRAAAATGDPEGLFYLGWVYYHGVGVAENATFAKMLWMRSLEASGIRSTRALAPLLALAGMRIDGWLAPLVGPHALARGIAQLQRGQVVMQALISLSGTGGPGKPTVQGVTGVDMVAGNDARAGDGVLLKAQVRSLTLVKRWVGQLVAAGGGVDLGNLENSLLLGLLAALLVVMVLRRRRLAVRT